MIDWIAISIVGLLLWFVGFALGCWVGNKKGWFRGYMQGFDEGADYMEFYDPNAGV